MGPAEFTMRIDSMAYGGKGVGRRHDGKVVFVSGAIPGEHVLVSVEKEHRGYVEARVVDILEPSPSRESPPCPYFMECGGCDWQHVEYSRQVALKNEILKEQLTRKGVCAVVVEEPVPSPLSMGYRCHATLRCIPTGDPRLGFFRRHSNEVVPVDRCMVMNSRLQDFMRGMNGLLVSGRSEIIEAMEVHAPGQDVIVRAILNRPAGKGIKDSLKSIYQGLGLRGFSYVSPGSHGREYILGEPFTTYPVVVHGREILFASSLGGFVQANLDVNRALIDEVIEKASGSRTLLDLYSGSGNFGIPLSLFVERVVAVEQDELLVEAGTYLARANGSSRIRFIHDDAVTALRRFGSKGRRFDTVVIDPPREGAREVVELLCSMHKGLIIYVSCNPSTLARDLGTLVQGGFSVKSLRLFDMFPQTFHIESLTVLEKA